MIHFFIVGEPQPYPKKGSTKKGILFFQDKTGAKRGWMLHIKKTAEEYMKESNKEIFSKETPLFMELTFYRTRPKSFPKKYKLPFRKPDVDNLAYAVMNPLSGICYADDSQICHQSIKKMFASENQEAGVWVTIDRFPVHAESEIGR